MEEDKKKEWDPSGYCDLCYQKREETESSYAFNTACAFVLFLVLACGLAFFEGLLAFACYEKPEDMGLFLIGLGLVAALLLGVFTKLAISTCCELFVGKALFTFLDNAGRLHIHPRHPNKESELWRKQHLFDEFGDLRIIVGRVGGIFRKSYLLVARGKDCGRPQANWLVVNHWDGFLRTDAVSFVSPMVDPDDTRNLRETDVDLVTQVLSYADVVQKSRAFRAFFPDDVRFWVRNKWDAEPSIPALLDRLAEMEYRLLAMIHVLCVAKTRGLKSKHAGIFRAALETHSTLLFGDDERKKEFPTSPFNCTGCGYPLIKVGDNNHNCVLCGTQMTRSDADVESKVAAKAK